MSQSQEGADPAAIERYESFVRADPENQMIWIGLGDLYHQDGRFDDAVACYEKCLQLDQDNMVARSHLANVLISMHRFDEAEKMLAGVIRHEPENAALWHNLGLSRYYQRHWAESLEAFEKARSAGLESVQNQAYLVYALHHSDDTDKALEQAQSWLDAAPGPDTEGYVAMLEMDHGDMEAATGRAQQVLRQQPDNADANIVIGTWKVEQQEIDEALDYFRQVLRKEPDSPRGWQGLGMTYLYNRDFALAIENFEKALGFMPGNATTLLLLGWSHLADRDAEIAERRFRESVVADRNFGEAHGGLAAALIFQNRQQEAREEIKRSLKLDPEGFGAVFANSVLLKMQGKGEMGQKMLARLFEQTPRPDGLPLIEYIQAFARKEATKKPPHPPE